MVLLSDSDVFILVQWEKVPLIFLVVEDDLSLWLRSYVEDLILGHQVVFLESLLLLLRGDFLHNMFLNGCPKALW